MKNFKLMTLCLLGLSVYGLQAGAEIEYTAMPSMAARKAMFNKQQPANNIAQIRSIDVNTPVNNVQAQRNLVTTRVDANAQKNTIIPKNLTVQQRTFSLAKPSVDQSVNQNQDLVVSSRQSLTLQPQEVVVGDPEKDLQQNKDQDDLGKNVNDGIVGLAKENVVENQQDNQLLIEKPQVEQPIALEAVAQNQDVVVENPESQGNTGPSKPKLTLEERIAQQKAKQSSEYTVDSSAIKQSAPVNNSATEDAAINETRSKSINSLIEKMNQNLIDEQVGIAQKQYQDAYQSKYGLVKSFQRSSYEKGLKAAGDKAKNDAISNIKNKYVVDENGLPRDNQQILQTLRKEQGAQSPVIAKKVQSNDSQADQGISLSPVEEMQRNSLMRQNGLSKEDATSQILLNRESKANKKQQNVADQDQASGNPQAVATASEVEVSQPDIDRQIYNDPKYKSGIDKKIAEAKAAGIKNTTKVKNQAIADIKQALPSDDLTMYKDKVIAKQQADAKSEADAKAQQQKDLADKKAAKLAAEKAEANVNIPVSTLSEEDVSLLNKKILKDNQTSIDEQLQAAMKNDPRLAASKYDQTVFKKSAADKIRQTMSDDQQAVLLQQAKDADQISESQVTTAAPFNASMLQLPKKSGSPFDPTMLKLPVKKPVAQDAQAQQ